MVVLKVVETNGKTGKPPPPAPADNQPALPAALDITIDMPGNIFVRGHGLESEWRGRLTITGTSAAPAITGSLEQIRGSVDLLGKTFTLTRGDDHLRRQRKARPGARHRRRGERRRHHGASQHRRLCLGADDHPDLDTPCAAGRDPRARAVQPRGRPDHAPAKGCSSPRPPAPSPAAVPGVLDRLRGGLGLDWFRLGSGPSGPASSTLNPRAASGAATGGTALSAGKYVAPGVSVGVSQGLSPPTSKVTVEIELRPHLTVQGEAGQSGSTGIGLNYNYDY